MHLRLKVNVEWKEFLTFRKDIMIIQICTAKNFKNNVFGFLAG